MFKALLLVSALLCLTSSFPKHECYPYRLVYDTGEFAALFDVVRALLPPCAILVLVFVPVHKEFFALMVPIVLAL